MSKNLQFLLFVPSFLLLYIAANSQNSTLGLVGVGLTVADAVAVLIAKK